MATDTESAAPTYQQVVASWNAQADEHNQWAELGEDEKIEWAMACAKSTPPPDYTEDVHGFVHDTVRRYYSEQTMRAYAERLHDARVKTLPTQLMAGLQAEVDALRHQLQTLAELGDASGDAQILRMGYAAARLEIENLNTQLQAAREEIKRRDAQEEAIGSGGVEPLRRRDGQNEARTGQAINIGI